MVWLIIMLDLTEANGLYSKNLKEADGFKGTKILRFPRLFLLKFSVNGGRIVKKKINTSRQQKKMIFKIFIMGLYDISLSAWFIS